MYGRLYVNNSGVLQIILADEEKNCVMTDEVLLWATGYDEDVLLLLRLLVEDLFKEALCVSSENTLRVPVRAFFKLAEPDPDNGLLTSHFMADAPETFSKIWESGPNNQYLKTKVNDTPVLFYLLNP